MYILSVQNSTGFELIYFYLGDAFGNARDSCLFSSALAIFFPPHQVFSFGKYAFSPIADRLRL